MKAIIISITLFLLIPTLVAQDTIPSAAPAQDTVSPAVAAAATPEPAPEAQAEPEAKENKGAWKKKMYYGGYINFSLGTYTSVGIEPMVGYKIIPRLSVGVKIRYDYVQDKRYTTTYTYSNYGGSIFTRLMVIKNLYLHAEYIGYNYESYNELGESSRIWVPYFLVGAGFRKPMGKRASLNVQVLFDVLQNDNSPYKAWEPFYSVGVGVGF